jgi:hypothetical protein
VVIVFEVMVMQRLLIRGAELPLQKASKNYIYNNSNRYRYDENAIINKGLLLQVGIADCFAARA